MATLTIDQLQVALNHDLNKTRAAGQRVLVNDAPRKIFTFKVDGAIFEFAHRQPDQAYWAGVKYYDSGSNSRVRIKRSQDEAAAAAAEAKPAAKAKVTRPRRVAVAKEA
jgi:uncharacterized protein (DUF1684 family)